MSGAEPYPERPCATLVVVVSVMNPAFSFQNFCRRSSTGQHGYGLTPFPNIQRTRVSAGTCLHVCKNNRRLRLVSINHVDPSVNRTSETSTVAQSAILHRRGPIGAAPRRWPPDIPSARCSVRRSRNRELKDLRALVPVQSDPLKIEVDFRPEYVSDPCPVVLLGFDEPFGIFDQCIGAERRPIFQPE